MALIKSISGIRGTIGGLPGDNLTPIDIVLFSSAYAAWLKENYPHNDTYKVVVGRDARISGQIVQELVINTLLAYGVQIVDVGLATTPTTEMAVIAEQAQGGIIITASHNPEQWNALKLLNQHGEFLSAAEGKRILQLSKQANFEYASINKLGTRLQKDYLPYHIQKILELQLVQKESIQQSNLKIVVDGINSVGSIAVPQLLNALGIIHITTINAEANGRFSHNPEPLDEHLSEIKKAVVEQKADLGIVVDPDVDRLAFICEDGSMFGEEYTLVAVADYVLSHVQGGVTVSNLSSSRALDDITLKHGGQCFHSAVGEVNVVQMMKEKGAVIGGEGNGGVIYPELHYGRDALVGIALFLSHFCQSSKTMTELRKQYPNYTMIKHKIELQDINDFKIIKEKLLTHLSYKHYNDSDGIRLDFNQSWVHCRPSNTEPIIRLYIEAPNNQEADEIFNSIKQLL